MTASTFSYFPSVHNCMNMKHSSPACPQHASLTTTLQADKAAGFHLVPAEVRKECLCAPCAGLAAGAHQEVMYINTDFSLTIIIPDNGLNMFIIHTYGSCFWRTPPLQWTYSVSLFLTISELLGYKLMNVTLTLKKILMMGSRGPAICGPTLTWRVSGGGGGGGRSNMGSAGGGGKSPS